jgi:hypothetical protein
VIGPEHSSDACDRAHLSLGGCDEREHPLHSSAGALVMIPEKRSHADGLSKGIAEAWNVTRPSGLRHPPRAN